MAIDPWNNIPPPPFEVGDVVRCTYEGGGTWLGEGRAVHPGDVAVVESTSYAFTVIILLRQGQTAHITNAGLARWEKIDGSERG